MPLTGCLRIAPAAPAKYADDFNGDGYRDYAASSYGPDSSGKGGGVLVTFGTANGPGTKTQFIDQSSPGVPGTDETDDDFGTVRTAADFNGDGYGDLAVSAPPRGRRQPQGRGCGHRPVGLAHGPFRRHRRAEQGLPGVVRRHGQRHGHRRLQRRRQAGPGRRTVDGEIIPGMLQ
ncbi:FG-GAP repeat protein [Streptomyces sp. NPDC017958]|uniref:FG-GAP repeat protein n=1 Tax=Streptomyces sp. NPDC017958 TaxID=3365021 RepID=UPI0037A3B29A